MRKAEAKMFRGSMAISTFSLERAFNIFRCSCGDVKLTARRNNKASSFETHAGIVRETEHSSSRRRRASTRRHDSRSASLLDTATRATFIHRVIPVIENNKIKGYQTYTLLETHMYVCVLIKETEKKKMK